MDLSVGDSIKLEGGYRGIMAYLWDALVPWVFIIGITMVEQWVSLVALGIHGDTL